jgi:Putative transposase/Transposase zinc-binding domain
MVELADIVRAAGPAYVTAHAGVLLPSQRRALTDIAQCRTAALGGSLYRCDDCGALDYRYHSCRNRHCPKCQADRAQQWLARVRARLLPCEHYLLTFTLPAELRALARRHQRLVYGALLREAAASVQAVTEDRAWVGGTPGILAVLHTWSRTLDYHPHVHLLVTAGGLTPDGAAWIRPAHPRFLLPGYVLSPIFRAKMRDALTRAGLAAGLDARVWQRRWTVHVARAGSGAHATLYLSRYVYRVALTNRRLTRFADGRVTFQYTHGRTHTTRSLTLPVNAFLTRVLQHVLPRGFTKVRWYGLLSAGRRADLDRARDRLALDRPPAEGTPPPTPRDAAPSAGEAVPPRPVPTSADRRAACAHGRWVLVQRYRPARAPPPCSAAA